jgi:hypothetical protein
VSSSPESGKIDPVFRDSLRLVKFYDELVEERYFTREEDDKWIGRPLAEQRLEVDRRIAHGRS